MIHPLEKALCVSFLLVGLSHVLHARRWCEFFERLFGSPAGPLAIAMYTLPAGLLVVLVHNVWRWDLAILVTIYGWAATIKGGTYFLLPGVCERVAHQRRRTPRNFMIAGLVVFAVGLAMGYDWLMRDPLLAG